MYSATRFQGFILMSNICDDYKQYPSNATRDQGLSVFVSSAFTFAGQVAKLSKYRGYKSWGNWKWAIDPTAEHASLDVDSGDLRSSLINLD